MSESLGGRLLRAAARSRKRRRLAGAILRPAAPLLPSRPRPRQPVFVLGSPRSGTTVVFEVLGRSSGLASIGVESHLLWEMFHPIERHGWTHVVTAGDLTERERRVLTWAVDRIAMGRRYLDKAPRNCLRVSYLHALFPDAWFVHVKRDGRAAVSSLITGWRDTGGLFPGIRLPRPVDIAGYAGTLWKFLVPPGWEEYVSGRSLEEVCAFQWIAANEALLDARDALGLDRWVEIRYEDFVADPVGRARSLLRRMGLPASDDVERYAGALDRNVSKAVTAPRPDKWRQENPDEVGRVLPVIAPTMRRLGYEVDEAEESRPDGPREGATA